MALPKDLSELLGKGENPNGMIAQTPNGTERDGMGSDGSEMRYNMADGERWNGDPMPGVAPLTPLYPEGRSLPAVARVRKR